MKEPISVTTIDLSSITLRVTDISTSAKTATFRVSGLGEVEVSDGGTLEEISVEIDEEGDQDAKVFYEANSTMVLTGVPESKNTLDPRVVTVTAKYRGVVAERKLSTLLDCTKPVFNSPLFLAVDPEDASSVTIETNVSDALTQITTRYFMSSDGGQSYQETLAGATVTGLDRSKTYNFKVVAKDEFGNEGVAYSNLPSTQAPQTGTVEHLFQGGNAVVSWDGFVPAEGYTIDYYLVDTYKGISQTTNTNYVMENLEDYTEYTVSVRAVGSNGVKSANVSVTFRTPDTTAPVVGTVTISDADDTGAATVSWSGFDDPETGIKSYKLKIGEVSQPLATDLDTTYQASGLSVGTHTVTVTATNGEGLTSTAATAEIDIPAPPPAGSNAATTEYSLNGSGYGAGLTGASTPIITTSSVTDNNASYSGEKAFDNIVQASSNYWHATWTNNRPNGFEEWIQVQFQQQYAVSQYKIWPRARIAGAVDAPKDFELQGSNDGSSWTVLDTRVDSLPQLQDNTLTTSAPGSDQYAGIFNVQNPGMYEYYRLVITATGGGDRFNETVVIGELALLFGDPDAPPTVAPPTVDFDSPSLASVVDSYTTGAGVPRSFAAVAFPVGNGWIYDAYTTSPLPASGDFTYMLPIRKTDNTISGDSIGISYGSGNTMPKITIRYDTLLLDFAEQSTPQTHTMNLPDYTTGWLVEYHLVTSVFHSATNTFDVYLHYTDDGGETVKSLSMLGKPVDDINDVEFFRYRNGSAQFARLRPASVFARALTAAEIDAYAPLLFGDPATQ